MGGAGGGSQECLEIIPEKPVAVPEIAGNHYMYIYMYMYMHMYMHVHVRDLLALIVLRNVFIVFHF